MSDQDTQTIAQMERWERWRRHQDSVDDSMARCLAERDYVQDRRLSCAS